MNDLINAFGQPYTFVRYAPPTTLKGQAVKPTPVLNDGQPWAMIASVQSLGTFDTLNLPEGYRNRDAQRVFTDTLMLTADEDLGVLGDRFQYRGKWYEIFKSADWLDTDLPYYKFIALKVEKA